MRFLSRLLNSRYFLWAMLGIPFVVTIFAYGRGQLFYGEVIHLSGELSARLMMLALLATPLLLMFPGKSFPRWLTKNRRYFGVASFAYAALHTFVYMGKVASWPKIFAEAMSPEYWTGWVAVLIFLLLAATSNDASVRRLKRAWKKLHRWVYVAAVGLFAHWLLVAFNRGPALVHLALLTALEGYRLWKMRRLAARIPVGAARPRLRKIAAGSLRRKP